MKKFALLAALVVVMAGPVLAQTQTTVTGTVVSSTSERLVIRTVTGDLTLDLTGSSDRPSAFTTGSYVTVWYNPTMVGDAYTLTKVEAGDADLDWANIKVVTGTVVSFADDDLILRTPSGDVQFDLDKNTPRPSSISPNNRLTVWYDADDKPGDHIDARKVVMAPAIASMVETTPPAVVPTTPPPAPTTEVADRLPDTASPLPFMLVTGLLSLAGAAGLRMRSRR